MNLAALTGEDRQFLRRLEDLDSGCNTGSKFTAFLTPRQLLLAQHYVQRKRNSEQALFYGGFSDAARQMLGFFPEHQPPDTALFPVRAVTVRYKQDIELTHRDFLGACLGLLLTRESIGDIIPETGICTIFVLATVEPILMQELKKVGSAGVRCEAGAVGEIVVHQEFESLRDSVPSTRLDCLVSLATGLSRDKSVRLIQSERVQLNYEVASSPSRTFFLGDILTIRGSGKFIVKSIGSPGRKGRLPVELDKYR